MCTRVSRCVFSSYSTCMIGVQFTRDELQNARMHVSHTCAQSLNRAVPYNNLSHTDTRFKTGRQHMIFLVHRAHTYTITQVTHIQ